MENNPNQQFECYNNLVYQKSVVYAVKLSQSYRKMPV